MADDLARVKDLYEWNKSLFSVLGIWPLEKTYVTFTVWIVYLVIHLSMEFSALYHVPEDAATMFANVSEISLETMILGKMISVRFSEKLEKIIFRVLNNIDAKHFDSYEEEEVYLYYNRIARRFLKLWLTMACVAGTMYHVKPLEIRLRAVTHNESLPFILPYQTRFFFDVNDATTFWIVWILQIPMIYIHMSYSMTIALIFALILHVCGQLSILALKIRNLEVSQYGNSKTSRITFRDIVEKHLRIVRMARKIDDVFRSMLVEELFVTTLVVCYSSYCIILSSDSADKTVFILYILTGSTFVGLIYGYCCAGEYLMVESINVYEAYYQMQWPDASNTIKKQMIICMIGASRPLQFTAGGLFIFSLESFTHVLKTYVSYISMIRKIT